jgi:hypothetical protein
MINHKHKWITFIEQKETITRNKIKNGFYVKKLNLFIIGKMVNFKGNVRFQGSDFLIKTFPNIEKYEEYLKNLLEKYNVFIEGSIGINSNRFRPLYLNEKYDIDRFFIQTFSFKNALRENYDQRCINRSGKPAGDASWNKINTVDNDNMKAIEEAKNIQSDISFIELRKWDDPIDILGNRIFDFFEEDILKKEFIEYSKNNSVIKKNHLTKIKKLF